jgi:hypothetical protein
VENGAFSAEDFGKWAEKYVLFLHNTSQVEGDTYPKLLSEKGGTGFPYLVFMDSDGNVLAKHEGQRGTAEFDKTFEEKVKAFLELKKKAEGGDAPAKLELFEKQLALRHFKADEARKKMAELGELPADKKDKFNAQILSIEIADVFATVTRDKATRIAAGKKLVEFKKAGRIPSGEREVQSFWILIMDHAEAEKDAALFEEALKAMRDKFGANTRMAKFFEEKEAILAKLKGGGEEKKPEPPKEEKKPDPPKEEKKD